MGDLHQGVIGIVSKAYGYMGGTPGAFDKVRGFDLTCVPLLSLPLFSSFCLLPLFRSFYMIPRYACAHCIVRAQ
jgi:hypothetical protein